MNAVFADTSFYVAAVSPKDAFHAKAMEFVRQYTGAVVTTEHVLIETGNWFARTQDRGLFLDLLDSIQTDPKTTVIWSVRPLFDAGLKLYATRMDKDWSVTDCISFVVMREHGFKEALTADHHFEQAGFRVLLR
jgi:predicted nucleic acid-binding protein